MWVNRKLFDLVVKDNHDQQSEIIALNRQIAGTQTLFIEGRTQKAKDDLSIDWMRHRVNALEKQNAVLMQKATGIAMPVPEIVPTRPGSMAGVGLDFDTMPSFDDCGNEEALRLGISHAADGSIEYTK